MMQGKERTDLMKVSSQQAEKLLRGNQPFSQLGFSMLLTRLKARYAKDPTQSTLQDCTSEINLFLDKFKAIMGSDFSIIARL